MSDYEAVSDVGKILIRLLEDGIDENEPFGKIITSPTQITQSSPEELTNDQLLSVFLYHVTEDTYQKNQGLQAIEADTAKRPPISLNLFYLIAANTDSAEKDNIVIGKVIEIFNNNPVLRGPALYDTSLDGESLNLIFNPLSLDEINKIWIMLSKSKPYKLSVYYEVTSVRIDSSVESMTSRVREV
jgi:hypothetical protein